MRNIQTLKKLIIHVIETKTGITCGSLVGSVWLGSKLVSICHHQGLLSLPGFFFFRDAAVICDHPEDKVFIVVHSGVYDNAWFFITALPSGAIDLSNYFMLPLGFSGGKWITMISVFQNIAWWNMLSYHPGAEVQVCKSVYFWGSGPWRRLPAWCRCLRSHLLPSPTIQSRTCAGGPSGSAVWSVPHQAAQ